MLGVTWVLLHSCMACCAVGCNVNVLLLFQRIDREPRAYTRKSRGNAWGFRHHKLCVLQADGYWCCCCCLLFAVVVGVSVGGRRYGQTSRAEQMELHKQQQQLRRSHHFVRQIELVGFVNDKNMSAAATLLLRGQRVENSQLFASNPTPHPSPHRYYRAILGITRAGVQQVCTAL